jgi:hypothetical protein
VYGSAVLLLAELLTDMVDAKAVEEIQIKNKIRNADAKTIERDRVLIFINVSSYFYKTVK